MNTACKIIRDDQDSKDRQKDTEITILVDYFMSHFLVLRAVYWAVKSSFADALAALALSG